MSVLAIDAGTTGITALIVAANGSVVSRGYSEFRQYFPQPGWVEQEPEDIWAATLAACGDALAGAGGAGGPGADPVSCVGITNQRETAVLWDRRSLRAPQRAIVWQDRRTARICDELRDAGHSERVSEITGLRLDPYFTATKLTWLARHAPQVWAGVADGSVAVGTVDSYLIARLTGGRQHVTDASNASRTLLFDLRAGRWSDSMCDLFGVPGRRLAFGRAIDRRDRGDGPRVVSGPVLAYRRGGWRSAGRALWPGLLRTGSREVHVRNRLVRAVQHRVVGRAILSRAAVHRGVDGSGWSADLRP